MEKKENDHLEHVKSSDTMTNIIDLIKSNLDFFLYHDFALAKSFQGKQKQFG